MQKSIKKSIRNRAGSGTAKIALDLRLPTFQRGRNLTGTQIQSAPKTINPAKDLISTPLSILIFVRFLRPS